MNARVDIADLRSSVTALTEDDSLDPAEAWRFLVALNELETLRKLVDSPQIDDFFTAVRLEAAHQTVRWGVDHDQGKAPTDWLWLLGFLAGKAVTAALNGDREKALHHTISSAAMLLNWNGHLSGARTALRPGIANPEGI